MHGSEHALRKIGAAVYAREGDLEAVAAALNKLHAHLNGGYDSLLGCMVSLAETPIARKTRSERLLGPGEVAVRLVKDYDALGAQADRFYNDLLAQKPIPADKLVERIISVGRIMPNPSMSIYSTTARDGIPRPRAYGTQYCSVRMKLGH